jgi:hypothetical protein
MNNSDWTWADLTGEQLNLVLEAERSLGADYLLAYQHDNQAQGRAAQRPQSGLRVAALSNSQLECLQGLETQLQATVVAYEDGNP